MTEKRTIRSESEEVHNRYNERVAEAEVSKSRLFQGMESKAAASKKDFDLLLEWIDTDQSSTAFMRREDLDEVLTEEESQDEDLAGLGLVLEGIWHQETDIIDEGLELIDSTDYQEFVSRTNVYRSMISEGTTDTEEYKDVIEAVQDLVGGVKYRDKTRAFMGATKFGRIDPEYSD